MKRTLPYLLLPVLFLFSCKKEHTAAVSAKYKITYNISGFSQQIIGSTAKHQINSLRTNAVTGLAASADFLYYRVYDFATGAILHQVNQDSSMTNFGSIVDYLPAGKYIVAFVASKPGCEVDGDGFGQGGGQIGFLPRTSWSDTFFQKDTLTVSGGDVNQSINLQRIVGQLTIKLLDIFPAAASTINVSVSQESAFFSIATSTTTSSVTTLNFTDPISNALKTTAGYQRSFFMMNTTSPFTVTLTCYDVSNNVLAQTVIPNVTVARNTQTILTGNVFATGAGFNVGLNEPFDPNQITVQF